MEFPRAELHQIAEYFADKTVSSWAHDRLSAAIFRAKAEAARRATDAYDQLAERCVMDATEASLEIAKKNLAIVTLETRVAELEAMQVTTSCGPVDPQLSPEVANG